MLSFLHLVVAIFCTTFISAEVKVKSQGKGLRDHSLDGKVSNEHPLFQTDVFTKLACASACMRYNLCLTFSTSPVGPPSKTMTCRGHDSRSVSQSSTVVSPGSQTYIMENKPPAEASGWLERPCTNNTDCPSTVSHVLCFAGQCLCQPGYYYSHSSDDCVPDCPSQALQSKFLKYAKTHLKGAVVQTIEKCHAPVDGQTPCQQITRCRTLNVRKDECVLMKTTALEQKSDLEKNSHYDHYQRTCL